MRYDTASSTYTLQIKDVQRPDEGTYQCQIIVAINNKVTRHVKLAVSQPPVIADNSTRSIVVQENQPAELICHALGSPTPSVSWRRQNNAILPTGGIQVLFPEKIEYLTYSYFDSFAFQSLISL